MNLLINLRIGLMTICVLLNLVQYHLFYNGISKLFYNGLININNFLLNTPVKIHGNPENLKKNKLLIMMNHYDGILDWHVMNKIYYKNNTTNMLHTIVKSDIVGDPEDRNFLSKSMSYLKNAFINSGYFIPYTRGNKEDGGVVKNKIVNSLHNDKNILIYPEGTTRRNGIPKDFKYGIFQLAIDNKLDILPITIKFNKDIGVEKEDPLNFKVLFDNTADVYIHDILTSETDEFYKNNDHVGLKDKTLKIISGPYSENN